MRSIFQHVLGLPIGDQPPVRAEPVPEEAPVEPIDETVETQPQPSQE